MSPSSIRQHFRLQMKLIILNKPMSTQAYCNQSQSMIIMLYKEEKTGLQIDQTVHGYDVLQRRENMAAGRPESVRGDNVMQRRENRATHRPESAYGDMFSYATRCSTKGPWNSLTVQGISNYPPDYQRTPDEILADYEPVIKEYFTSDEKRELLRDVFLHSVLPHIEEFLKTHGSPSVKMLKVLPLLCCSGDCQVRRYVLYLTLHVLSKCTSEVDDKMQVFLVDTEEQIRQSVVGEDRNIFDAENPEDQGLRVFVYSRVLMMFALLIKYGIIRATIDSKVASICELRDKLMSLSKQPPFIEDLQSRYALSCIHEAITILNDQPKERPFCEFLKWLQRYDQKKAGDKKERDKFLSDFVDTTSKNKSGWFDYHLVVFCLQPRIHQEPSVVEILLTLVDQYIKVKRKKSSWNSLKRFRLKGGSEEEEWQTWLHLNSILEDIAMKNKDEVTRKVAREILHLSISYLNENKNSTDMQRFLEQSLEKCCFGSDRETVLAILGKEDPMTVQSSMNYLESSRYKQQMIPQSYKSWFEVEGKGFFKTTFRGKPSVVKILVISSGVQQNFQAKGSKQCKDMVREAYFLRRLNVSPHPNIVRVFAYDTHSEPYHIITEYADKGTLLQFLQDARSDIHPLPKPSILLEMILGVIDGLLYLLGDDKHLVHQAIMSSNILVSKDRTCKLTGFQALQQMAYNQEDDSYEYISKKDEASIRHAAPEILNYGCYSEKSMIFHCGCVLFEMFTYGNIPYNWISDSEAVQIRRHVLGDDTTLEKKCIPKVIVESMKECHSFDPFFRPNLSALKRRLIEVQKTFLDSPDADRPSTELSFLTKQDKARAILNSCYSLDQLVEPKDKAEAQNLGGSPETKDNLNQDVDDDGYDDVVNINNPERTREYETIINLNPTSRPLPPPPPPSSSTLAPDAHSVSTFTDSVPQQPPSATGPSNYLPQNQSQTSPHVLVSSIGTVNDTPPASNLYVNVPDVPGDNEPVEMSYYSILQNN